MDRFKIEVLNPCIVKQSGTSQFGLAILVSDSGMEANHHKLAAPHDQAVIDPSIDSNLLKHNI